MARSDWTWQICGWHVYGEYLQDVPCSCESVSGGSSTGEIEPGRVYFTVFTIDAMEDGEYSRHGSSGHKVGRDSGVALLLRDSFLHQPNVPFLLLDGTALGSQRGLEDVM